MLEQIPHAQVLRQEFCCIASRTLLHNCNFIYHIYSRDGGLSRKALVTGGFDCVSSIKSYKGHVHRQLSHNITFASGFC